MADTTHSTTRGAGLRFATTATKAKGYGPDPACQPCPDCGGLECLCRPRFFSGMLLTDEDLGRLADYVVEKNKLQRRYLEGTGVVCGLVASCSPCDNTVRVSDGYAISPCGEDIIVCAPDEVDICALINACREVDGPDCRPYGRRDLCDDVEEDWILALRYVESQGAPKRPMTGNQTCGCGGGSGTSCGCGGGGASCGCGGGSSCRCGGGASCSCGSSTPRFAAAQATLPRLRRDAAPSCEPTLICEGYRWEVFRAPDEDDDRRPGGDDDGFVGAFSGILDRLDGEMAERMACCLRDLEAHLPRLPGSFDDISPNNQQIWFRWCCDARNGLIDWFGRNGGGNCRVLDQLAAFSCPSPDLPFEQFRDAILQSFLRMLNPLLEAFLHCICTNALPPCPCPDDPRVPIARVTVRRSDCTVLEVCNWTPLRRHVVTNNTLGYWLGWTPVRRFLRDGMEALCCELLGLQIPPPRDDTPPGSVPQPEGDIQPPDFDTIASADARRAATLDDPLSTSFGTRSLINPTLARAFATSLGNRVSGDSPVLRQRDLLDVLARRPRFDIGEGREGEDDAANIDRIAQSGIMRVLADVTASAFEGLPDLNVSRPTDSYEATPKGADAEMRELRSMVESQAKELAALRARMDDQ